MDDLVRGVEGADGGQPACAFDEPGGGLRLGALRVLGEGAAPQIVGGDVEDGLLVPGAVVGVDVRYVGEDEQEVGLEFLGEQGGREVLVDDRLDPGQRAGVVVGGGP